MVGSGRGVWSSKVLPFGLKSEALAYNNQEFGLIWCNLLEPLISYEIKISSDKRGLII